MKPIITLLLIIIQVNVGISQDWERLSFIDDYDPGLYGYYENLNDFAPHNCPGLKEAYIKWTTEESVYVLESIGSYEIFTENYDEVYVMLWEFNKELMQWRCVQDKLASDINHGIKGVSHPDNFPGFRTASPTWVDHNNDLWLFSGQQIFGEETYIDLWKFDTETKMWSYMNGAISENGITGSYEELGVPSPTALPNSRPSGLNSLPISFVDRNGDLVLFRGSGSNDLWRYNINSNEWVWLYGEDPILNISFYNYESPRSTATDRGVFWTDDENNYYFLDEIPTRSTWRIWKFDNDVPAWSLDFNDYPLFLQLSPFREESEETNIISLNDPLIWNQNNEYLWLFGGEEKSIMYRLNLDSYQWTYFNGTTKVDDNEDPTKLFNGPGFAFKKGEERAINQPPGRSKALNWEKEGKYYIGFGTVEHDPSYDIWSYNLSSNQFALEKGSSHNYLGINYDSCQYNQVDTTIHIPSPFQDDYKVGAIKYGEYVYQFDANNDIYQRDLKTGINKLLREKLPNDPGTIGTASEEVYPSRFEILGMYNGEVYGYSSIFEKRIYKYNFESNLFTCVQEVDGFETGPAGIFNNTNFPRLYKIHFASWVDEKGQIYLFNGGSVWSYRTDINQWAILGGIDSDRDLKPMYYYSNSKFNWWIDDVGDLWVFNYSMWKYDTSENDWELIKHGMPEVNTSFYGEQSDFGIFNNPSSRMQFINWKDEKGRFWMAHGRANYESNNFEWTVNDQRVYNDIWMFDPRIENWVWLSGPKDAILRRDTFFNRYTEEPYTNVMPLSSAEDYTYHNAYTYNENNTITVIENCDGSIWSLDYSALIPEYNILSGQARYDLDANGCDTLDPGVPNLQIIVNDFDAYTFTDSLGQYAQFCNETACNFTARLNAAESTYFTINPNDTLVDFGGYGQTKELDYCLVANGTFHDVEVLIVPLDFANSGFDSRYQLIVNNKGTSTLSGTLKLYYNRQEVTLESFDQDTIGPAHFNINLDTLQWRFDNLKPFNSQTKNLEFRIFPSNSGDTITYLAEACLDSIYTDYMIEDNSFTLKENVVGSLDPNDKTILEGDLLPFEIIGDYVHYRIRFENTGTAPARFIYLEDYIDTETFDIQTLIPLNASHSYTAQVEDVNKLFVMFDDIYLSHKPEEGNTGFFIFKIKTKENLTVSDLLINKAKIYFDYNDPIETEESIAMFDSMVDFDQDGFYAGEDCDDTNPDINPDQIEEPYNGLDDDCDSATLDNDLDQDGFLLFEDCDDNNNAIHPNAEEIPNNGIDEDCDGMDLVSSTYEIANSIINIYPNPATDVINIDIENQFDFQANLYTMGGKLIKSVSNSKQLKIHSIPAGIYLLEIRDLKTGQKVVEKIEIEM